MFLYTSGSTGTPKGVVLSHRSHIWVVETRLAPGLDRHRYLIAAPLYHMNALALSLLACAAHATNVLLPQFTARAYIEAIERYRATWLTAVPPMIAMMLREHDLLARTDLSSVEFIRMGSAPVSQSLMQALHRALPKATVTNAYGTTEAGPVVFGPHPKGLQQPEMSVGYPHPQVQLRLVDGDNRDADEGVLEMKCPAVMLGYHNRPDVQPPFTADGYYITGDVFRRDADGFHYFVGRTDDMFVSGGENIYPADVERMLERHPDVAQAAVVPIEDEIKGQKPVAFVIPKPGRSPSEDEIKKFALANAPAYQHPRFVWFVEELPLASTNKVDRNRDASRKRMSARSDARRVTIARARAAPECASAVLLQPRGLDHRAPALDFLLMKGAPSPGWNRRPARGPGRSAPSAWPDPSSRSARPCRCWSTIGCGVPRNEQAGEQLRRPCPAARLDRGRNVRRALEPLVRR